MVEPSPPEVALVGGFDELYRREYPALVGVATALAGADGEDLVQDAMVRTLVHWEKVRRLDRPGAWCHRVLVNLCRSWWRRGVTAGRYLVGLRRDLSSATPTGGPELAAEVIAFWAAVRRLPDRQRQVMALHYAGDRPVAEIAQILGVPEGTVRSDLTRARAVLQSADREGM